MADEFEYEALPQRQPRRKRQRNYEDIEAHIQPKDSDDHPIEEASAGKESDQDGQSSPPPAQHNNDTSAAKEQKPDLAHHTVEEYRAAKEEGYNFEYLDHTADVQLHAWGKTLQEAFENVALAMFNYMTPLSGIDVDRGETKTYEAEAHDLDSLLFQFLDELLFGFSTEFFVPGKIQIQEFDRTSWKLVAIATGEKFDRSKHACGTEIKAITYSAMQINESPDDCEVFVIVDI